MRSTAWFRARVCAAPALIFVLLTVGSATAATPVLPTLPTNAAVPKVTPTLSVSETAAIIGDTFTLTVGLHNAGGDLSSASASVALSSKSALAVSSFSAGCSAVSATNVTTTSSSGAVVTLPILTNANSVACSLGPLPSGADTTASFVFRALQVSDEVLTVSCSYCAGPTTTIVTITQPSADLRIAMQATNRKPQVGASMTSNVTITNLGPNAAPQTSVLFKAPVGVALLAADAVGATCKPHGCTLPALASGASTSISLTLKATKAGPFLIGSIATVQQALDPVYANDSASLAITAVPAPGSKPARAGKKKKG